MTRPLLLPRALKKRHGSGGFGIEILYPGLAEPGGDSGLGAIGRIDHARVTAGTVIKMHPHRDDEILTYLRRGRVRHRDSVGHVEEISPTRLMLMNAGHSFEHEEEVLEGPLEALQIFLRPRAADLEPLVQFHDFGAALSEGAWRLVAGPRGRAADGARRGLGAGSPFRRGGRGQPAAAARRGRGSPALPLRGPGTGGRHHP